MQKSPFFAIFAIIIIASKTESLEIRNMKDKELLDRIILNPEVMTGKPIIRGTRLTVEFILNLLAHGTKEDEILLRLGHSKRLISCL